MKDENRPAFILHPSSFILRPHASNPHHLRSDAPAPRSGALSSNGSSGRMGKALAEAAIAAG